MSPSTADTGTGDAMGTETKKTHSPEPWTKHHMANGRPYVQFGADQRSGDGSCDVHGLKAEENADLIAAAPKMHAVLAALVEMDDAPADGPIDYMDRCEVIVARARALLAEVQS